MTKKPDYARMERTILEQRARLDEMTWLLTHEPPDDLGGMTQALRRKWCERRDAVLAQKGVTHERNKV
jgi:hypothetical protein